MRDGWVETTLAEVAQLNPEQARDFQSDKLIKYVDLSKVDFDSGIDPEINLISFKNAPGRARRVIRKNDVIVSTVRPYLRGFALVGENFDGQIASTGFCVVRAKSQHILSKFVWALVSSQDFVDSLIEKSTGSNYPAVRPNDIGQFKFELPPLVEQKRIVDLISSVDSYIEALQQQLKSAKQSRNAVLHQLLTTRGEGWVETTLGGIAEYINGYPFKPEDLGLSGLPVIRIKQLLNPEEPVDRSGVDVPEKCLLRDGDIVFSWSGTLAVKVWNRGPAKLNQHLFRVVEKPGVHRGIVPLMIDHALEELAEKSHGTTMKHITKQTLLPHKVMLPPHPEQVRIVDLVATVDSYIEAIQDQLASSVSLRSGLLADLLNGEHEIPASYDQLIGPA
jgi:restriction endonuclease S subunit